MFLFFFRVRLWNWPLSSIINKKKSGTPIRKFTFYTCPEFRCLKGGKKSVNSLKSNSQNLQDKGAFEGTRNMTAHLNLTTPGTPCGILVVPLIGVAPPRVGALALAGVWADTNQSAARGCSDRDPRASRDCGREHRARSRPSLPSVTSGHVNRIRWCVCL